MRTLSSFLTLEGSPVLRLFRKPRVEKDPQARSKVSILPQGHRAFRYFLSATVCLSVALTCIENGLHPLVLVALPVMIAALVRRNYTRPLLWSERVSGGLFAVYLVLFIVGSTTIQGRLFLPVTLVYFTFGVLMVRALSPLTDRHIAQVIFLSVGMVLINCILTNHLIFGVLIPVYLFLLMGTLLMFHLARNGNISGEEILAPVTKRVRDRWYGKFLVYAVGICTFTLVMFVFIPRPFLVLPGFAAGVGGAGGMGVMDRHIGYRDMVNMAGGNRIAFRIKTMLGELPASPYWRGKVLDSFDGKTWTYSGKVKGMGRLIHYDEGEALVYLFIPYRLNSKTVYVAGLPVEVLAHSRRNLFITKNAEVIVDSTLLYSDAYEVLAVDRSVPNYGAPDPENLATTGLTTRIEDLARRWTAQAATPQEKAQALERRLREGYQYSLRTPPSPDDVNPIEYFLFQARAGHCEYFAGALCLMLRAAGIPARIVVGFHGAEPTDNPDEFVVRFSQAHAWVEALLDGRSWTLLDSTPPTRDEMVLSRVARMLTDAYDWLDYQWVRRVVYFDRSDQAKLFNRLLGMLTGEIPFSLGKNVRIAAAGVGVVLVLILCAAASSRLVRLRRKRHDYSGVYLATMKELVDRGVLDRVYNWHELNSARIIEKAPYCRDTLERFTDTYLRGRFGGRDAISREELDAARLALMHVLAESP